MSYVYAITDGDYIKVGIAQTPHKRLKQLATGSAKPLKLIGYFEGGRQLEKEFHNTHQKVRQNGEWLLPTDELVSALNERIHDKHIMVQDGRVMFFNKMQNLR